MKKTFLILFLLLKICELNAQTASASQEENPQTWQEQIDFMKKQSNLLANQRKDEFKFIGYKHLGKIKSQKQIDEYWKYMSADDTKIVSYPNDKYSYYTFEIVPLKQERKRLKDLNGTDMYEFIKKDLEPIVGIGKELIRLDWEYEGETIHSLGLISQGKIVFDYIGSMIVSPDSVSHRREIVR